MKLSIIDTWNSLLKLSRFLAWYVINIAGIFYALPMVGQFLDDRYDAVARPAKLVFIIGFFATIAWLQAKSRKQRVRDSERNPGSGQMLLF